MATTALTPGLSYCSGRRTVVICMPLRTL